MAWSFPNRNMMGELNAETHYIPGLTPRGIECGLNKPILTYNITGSDIVEKPVYKNGNVYINAEQCFGNVPEITWNFYIGGYQPAQKWLKDRRGRTLTNEDIEHYQKIIIVLMETDRIMREIDNVIL